MIDPMKYLELPTDKHDHFEGIADATCKDLMDSFNSFRHKSDIIRLLIRVEEVVNAVYKIMNEDGKSNEVG
jgi:hypothetical protein